MCRIFRHVGIYLADVHIWSCPPELTELSRMRNSNTGTTKVSKCEKGRGAEGDRADIDCILHMGGETKQR